MLSKDVPGVEITRFVDSHGQVIVKCVVYSSEDLVITNETEMEIIFPKDHEVLGGFKVRFLDPEVNEMLQERLDSDSFLSIPWALSTKYPIDVAFHAGRYFLKSPPWNLWTSSFRIDKAFSVERDRIDVVVPADANKIMLFSGTGRTVGRRNYMEDCDFTFSSIKISDKATVSIYGVLDGHGGKECASFMADEIPMKITSSLRSGKSSPEAMYKAFIDTDAEFMRSESSNAGSTGTVVLYNRLYNEFLIASVGDTRAVLSRQGQAFDLTVDHKATLPEEVVRIANAGGFVVNGRVLGSLAVSRAFGDAALKTKGPKTVIAEPEFSCFFPSAGDEFLIIATDGLWDVMSSQDAIKHVRDILIKESLIDNSGNVHGDSIVSRLNSIASQMAIHAEKNLNSQDNITVMIVLVVGATAASERTAAKNARTYSSTRPLVTSKSSVGAGALSSSTTDFSTSQSTLLRSSGSGHSAGSSSKVGVSAAWGNGGGSLSARIGAAAFKETVVDPSTMTASTVMFRRTTSGSATAISAASTTTVNTAPLSPSANGQGGFGYSERVPLSFETAHSKLVSGNGAFVASSNGGGGAIVPSVSIHDGDDDDLMNFLTDDSNF